MALCGCVSNFFFFLHKIATYQWHFVLTGVCQLSEVLEINVLSLNVMHDINVMLLLHDSSARSV